MIKKKRINVNLKWLVIGNMLFLDIIDWCNKNQGFIGELLSLLTLIVSIIGEYTFCTSSTKSLGTFIPSENANPYIGERNKLEFVEEEKLEFVCDVEKVKNVIEELRKSHPYEEPAIDIIPLIDESEF